MQLDAEKHGKPNFLRCVVCKIFATNWRKSGRNLCFPPSPGALSLCIYSNEGEVKRSCGMHNLFLGLLASCQIRPPSSSTLFNTCTGSKRQPKPGTKINWKKKHFWLISWCWDITKSVWQSIFIYIPVCWEFLNLRIWESLFLKIHLYFFVHCSLGASMFEILRINQPWNTILNLWACIHQVSIHWDGMEHSLGVGKELNMNLLSTFPFQIQCSSNTMHPQSLGRII